MQLLIYTNDIGGSMKKILQCGTILATGLLLIGCSTSNSSVKQVKHSIEINTNVTINDIFHAKKGYKIESNDKINTGSLGEKNVTIKISHNKKIVKYKYKINIVDTTPPKIFAKDKTIFIGDKFNPISDVKCEDNSKEKIDIHVDKKNLDLKKAGTYKVLYFAKDSSKNKSELYRKIIVRKEYSMQELKNIVKQYISSKKLTKKFIVKVDKYNDNIYIPQEKSIYNNVTKTAYTDNSDGFGIIKKNKKTIIFLSDYVNYFSYDYLDYLYVDSAVIKSSIGKMPLKIICNQNTDYDDDNVCMTKMIFAFENIETDDGSMGLDELKRYEKILHGKNISIRFEDSEKYVYLKPNKKTINNMISAVTIYKYLLKYVR